VAISSSRELTIGIDVEDKDGKINAQKCSRFFSENEIAEMQNGISPIEIWTKKEALFKHLKNDSLVFITLDTTVSNCHFNTQFFDCAVITLCTEKCENINIIDKKKM
jgi:4'-phosphopantetheinyl transferase EntD